MPVKLKLDLRICLTPLFAYFSTTWSGFTFRREEALSDEQQRLLERNHELQDSRLAVRELSYNQQLSALDAQKQMLMERLDRAEQELEERDDTNHSGWWTVLI